MGWLLTMIATHCGPAKQFVIQAKPLPAQQAVPKPTYLTIDRPLMVLTSQHTYDDTCVPTTHLTIEQGLQEGGARATRTVRFTFKAAHGVVAVHCALAYSVKKT